MSRPVDRRRFLSGVAAVSGAAVLAPSVLRMALADAATVVGSGPYGALATTADAHGFLLPTGFTSRLLAVSGSTVPGTGYVWHRAPDGGACFPAPDGGWAYVSNSEVPFSSGGASALRFDASGAVVDAYRILSGTNVNCAGGRTAAGTWLSCEEKGATGQVYECDPLAPGQGVVRPALGSFNHEAAVEDPRTGAVYLTEDDPQGRLYRFVPTVRGDLSAGRLDAASVSAGVVSWVPTSATGPDRQATTTPFKGGEGIDLEGRLLFFTTKGDKRVWRLHLDTGALSVVYDGVATPNAALNAVDNLTVHRPSGDLFVCEDGGNMEVCVLSAVGAGDIGVAPFLRIVGHDSSEWAGAAFSPDHTRLYLSSQRGTNGIAGRTYEITGPFRTAPTPTTSSSTSTSSTSTSTTSTTAAALTTTIGVSDDAHVRDGGDSRRNYGSATSAQIRSGGTGVNRWYYVKVDTSAHTRPVTSARLQMRASTSGTRTPLVVRAVSTGWTESGLTWRNKPTPGAVIGAATVVGGVASWIEVDVTAHVLAERGAGRRVVGFVVQAARPTSALVNVASAEATTAAFRPRLLVSG